MAVGDIPSIASSTYGSDTSSFNLSAADMYRPVAVGAGLVRDAQNNLIAPLPLRKLAKQELEIEENPEMASRRLVKVIIVDPNENIPLEDCVLYSGSEKLTDATDQELFFELDIKNILDTHNAKRTKVIDKKVKERTEYLEPAKIRDLKMVVVNVATF